jgi:peptidyl-dipeptidase Dcp
MLGPAPARAEPALALAAPWPGAHGGLPPFDRVRVEDFEPALVAAMAEQRREVALITARKAAPTFANTVVALERSGQRLDRVRRVYWVWSSSLSTPPFEAVERRMAPLLAAFDDELVQNTRLFARIQAVAAAPAAQRLPPEQQRLLWLWRTRFVKGGAQLDAAGKQRVAAINQRLALLYTTFAQNQRADEQEQALVIDDAAGLAGLSAADIAAAAAEAGRRGLAGRWAIANTRSAMEPLLSRASRRDLREQAWRLFTARGDNGGAHDNNGVVAEILALRAERSHLLGYASFADWQLTDTMAREPQAVLNLLLQVWRPALAQVQRDVAAMQKIADAEAGGPAPPIAPWDYRYYAEKLRKAAYDLDLDELTPYLQLDRVREAMFWAAGRLYGLRFVPVSGVPVFHPDVSVWEVTDGGGHHVGLWYFDPWARPGKSSGAWMNSYRAQGRLDAPVSAIVSNNANFIRGAAGAPVTISWDDAVTMFHEFGHALHGLASNVTYPSLASPQTLADFGEFPSQLNEHWLRAPQVLALLVDKDGHALPRALVDKFERAQTFDKAFEQTEYLASAFIDIQLHLQPEGVADPRAFEQKLLAELGMPPQIVARHRIPHFGHVFAGEGYAAGYYNYLWAAVLEHDAYAAFVETGDLFDPTLARRLHDKILAVGNTVDPGQAFRDFRGRDPKVDALLRDYGFATAP